MLKNGHFDDYKPHYSGTSDLLRYQVTDCRALFTSYSLISALSTAFFPFAVSHYTYAVVFATRLVQVCY